MSIIRQRHKNQLIAGSIGFFAALILVLTVYLTAIRGNPEAMNMLLVDSHLEVEKVTETDVSKEKVYIFLEDTPKGIEISREMLQAVEVNSRLLADSCILNMEDIIGFRTAGDVAAKTFITAELLTREEKLAADLETVEIHLENIPEIIETGDFINVHIHFPTGHTYKLLESKEVLHMNRENSMVFTDMDEGELLAYSSAIEDCNRYDGTYLYLTEMTPGDREQTALMKAYPMNPDVIQMAEGLSGRMDMLSERKVLDECLTDLDDEELYDYTRVDESVLAYEESASDLSGSGQDEVSPLEEADEGQSEDGDSTEGEKESQDPVFDF